MISVCPELEKRLDSIWTLLELTEFDKGMSQIELDTVCVDTLEKLVVVYNREVLKKEMRKKRRLTNG